MHLTLTLSANECRVLIKQTCWDHDITTRERTTVKIRQIASMRQNIWSNSDWQTNSMTAHRCLHVVKSNTEHTHTHRWITVSFITPRGAILCTAEMWRIPSLINVEAAPINIFISAYAPCWKHIQGEFKLYELISYLLRQLSMPTPSPFSPNIFSFPFSPMLSSIPPLFPFLHTAEMGFEHLGFTRRATSLEDLKFLFRFNRLVWGKFERTHSQPGDIQYDKKAGSYLITSCIKRNRERRTAYAGWCNINEASCVQQFILQSIYNTTSFSYCPSWETCTNTPTLPLLLCSSSFSLALKSSRSIIKSRSSSRVFTSMVNKDRTESFCVLPESKTKITTRTNRFPGLWNLHVNLRFAQTSL